MKQSGAKPGRRIPWIRWILAVLALAAAYHVLAGPRGLLRLAELRARKSAVESQIDSLQAHKRELTEEKRRLLTDTLYLEKLARRELGMARPGEKVYRFVAPSGAPDSAAFRR